MASENVLTEEIPIKLRAAYREALLSPDTSTKLGAIVVDGGWNVAVGRNEFVRGFGDKPEHHERPLKYAITEHAERNAIFGVYRRRCFCTGLTLVCPWVACPDCARAIVLSGIREVICHKECMDRTPDRWRELVDMGLLILERGGVKLIQWSGKVGGVKNLNNGEIWLP